MAASPFRRSQVSVLNRRLHETPRWIVAVFGPRQTGKTTIVRQALEVSGLKHTYLPVDAPDTRTLRLPSTDSTAPSVRDAAWIVWNWERARIECDNDETGAQHVLLFDEIQKIADWSEAVKGLWDADRAVGRPLHVVVLGSAPLLMQSGLTESLMGRFETIRVRHWSFAEMQDAFGFGLDEYCYFGGYPGTAALVSEPDRWRDYVLGSVVEPTVERDVLEVTRVDKPLALKRLFEVGAAFSGQILTYSKMANLTGAGNETTVARYLDLLGQTGLVAGLPAYVSPARRRRSSPKLIALNSALMAAMSDYTFEEARADRSFWGRVVESVVGAHLLNSSASNVHVNYWRDRGLEVDFVVQRGTRLVVVEVKSSAKPGGLQGRDAFQNRFPGARSVLVGAQGGVPLAEFLSKPAGDWVE